MVMRYWGTTNVYAETLADWWTLPPKGSWRGSAACASIAGMDGGSRSAGIRYRAGLPPGPSTVVAYPGSPRTFHYVVIVGWSPGRVIAHDPARAPFRVLDEQAFDEAWKVSGYWTLAAAPPVATTNDTAGRAGTLEPARSDPAGPTPRADAPCSGMVDEGVRLAGAGDTAGARRILRIAADNCPDAAGPWREMAGLHGSPRTGGRRRSIKQGPRPGSRGRALAARILANRAVFEDARDRRLEAWNLVRQPIVDLVTVTGLERIRYASHHA